MIKEFVDIWHNRKKEFENLFCKHPKKYKNIVKGVIKIIQDELYKKYFNHHHPDIPSSERITEIKYDDYSGTLLYIIASVEVNPTNNFWFVKISYGSCSGCDTLESIKEYGEDKPVTEDQLKEYMILALHIIQKLKKLENNEDEEN